MNQKTYLGQDVLYTLPTTKEECAAKVVRIVDRTKQIVNLTIFSDGSENTSIVRNVQFDEAGTQAPNTWRHIEQHEQSRGVGAGSAQR